MNFLHCKNLLKLLHKSANSPVYKSTTWLRFCSSEYLLKSNPPNKFYKTNNNGTKDVKKPWQNKRKYDKFGNLRERSENFRNTDVNSENANINTDSGSQNFYKNFGNSKDKYTKNYNFNHKDYSGKSGNKKYFNGNNFKNNKYTQESRAYDSFARGSRPPQEYARTGLGKELKSDIADIDYNESEVINRLNSDIPEDQDTIETARFLEGEEKEFEELSKQSLKIYKANCKLDDNPMYKKELKYEDEIKKRDSDDDPVSCTKELTSSEKDDSIKNKTKYPVYHFDHKLQKYPDDDNDTIEETEINRRRKTIETSEGIIDYDLSSDEFNLKKYMDQMINTEPLRPLEKCNEDISDFGKGLGPSFNFASFANKSELVQEYIKLGVELYKVEENQDSMRALLTVDPKKELPIYLRFFHDCGVPADCLGKIITKNPMILKEDLDDMKTRIRYLKAHDFTINSIARIVTENPTWLTWATKHIDERLGHFQNEFKLSASEVRFLATKQPRLITYKFKHIHENTFAVREEMGFSKQEIKVLLLSKPRLWMNNRTKIVDSFEYLHKTMKLSHLMIASMADVLTCRKSRLKSRHEFLVELKRAQYDPKKSNYVSPKSVAAGSDVEFCRDIAKASIDTYNLFLKTR